MIGMAVVFLAGVALLAAGFVVHREMEADGAVLGGRAALGAAGSEQA